MTNDEQERLKQKLVSRIVEEDGPLDTQCWVWVRGRNNHNYGLVHWKGEMWLAHRLSYICFVGPIPDGLQVNHHCDQTGCIRPEHLYTGTQQDNLDDMVRRGRSLHRFGETGPRAKLSDDKVASIKFLISTNCYSLAAIAEHFNVSQSAIQYIATGGGWPHIAPATSYDGPPVRDWRLASGEGHWCAVLTEQDVMTIKRLLLNGVGNSYIAYRFGVDQRTISEIKVGNKWAYVDPLPTDAEIIYPSPEKVAARVRWQQERYGSSLGENFVRRI